MTHIAQKNQPDIEALVDQLVAAVALETIPECRGGVAKARAALLAAVPAQAVRPEISNGEIGIELSRRGVSLLRPLGHQFDQLCDVIRHLAQRTPPEPQ